MKAPDGVTGVAKAMVIVKAGDLDTDLDMVLIASENSNDDLLSD